MAFEYSGTPTDITFEYKGTYFTGTVVKSRPNTQSRGDTLTVLVANGPFMTDCYLVDSATFEVFKG